MRSGEGRPRRRGLGGCRGSIHSCDVPHGATEPGGGAARGGAAAGSGEGQSGAAQEPAAALGAQREEPGAAGEETEEAGGAGAPEDPAPRVLVRSGGGRLPAPVWLVHSVWLRGEVLGFYLPLGPAGGRVPFLSLTGCSIPVTV